jgi:molybdenum cofactor cytidylyltransferase
MFVTGLVLAAGGSSRLGEPKQLLPYREKTLLDATIGMARSCGFDQLLVTLGGSAAAVRERVDLSGTRVVENPEYGAGCSSSIVTALAVVDPGADGIVLLLGDQPGVSARAVQTLVDVAATMPLGACRYEDGLGHPLWFGRAVFGELRELHGDKAVWRLLESGPYPVTFVPVAGPVPLDVNDRDGYEALLARDAGAGG